MAWEVRTKFRLDPDAVHEPQVVEARLLWILTQRSAADLRMLDPNDFESVTSLFAASNDSLSCCRSDCRSKARFQVARLLSVIPLPRKRRQQPRRQRNPEQSHKQRGRDSAKKWAPLLSRLPRCGGRGFIHSARLVPPKSNFHGSRDSHALWQVAVAPRRSLAATLRSEERRVG